MNLQTKSVLELQQIAGDINAPHHVQKRAIGELMARQQALDDMDAAVAAAEDEHLRNEYSTEPEQQSNGGNKDGRSSVRRCSHCGDPAEVPLLGFPKTYCKTHYWKYCPFCGAHTEYDNKGSLKLTDKVCSDCHHKLTDDKISFLTVIDKVMASKADYDSPNLD